MAFGKIYESTWWGVGVCAATNYWGSIYSDISGCDSASVDTLLFIDRVEADGGIIESSSCIDEKITFTVYSNEVRAFRIRVDEDNGVVESVECIDSKLKLI